MTVNETRDSSTSPELVTGPHTLAAEEVAARLDVRSNFGLTSEEARQRRVQYGPNRLPEAPPRSAWCSLGSSRAS
ncbi:MAG: cation-transporting P-type ATPase [Chromatiales bacterium]